MLPPTPPSISAGGGGPSGSSSNASTGTPINTPFNFDSSGWNIMFQGSGNNATATGNRDANASAQTTPGAGLGAMLGFDPKWLLLAAAVVLLLKRQ